MGGPCAQAPRTRSAPPRAEHWCASRGGGPVRTLPLGDENKPNPRANIDAIIALAMAVERAEQQPEPVQLLGWL